VATIYVREISEDTLATLRVRAAKAGQSLQAYLRQLLDGEAAALTAEEAAKEARGIATRGTVTADDVTDVITEMRETRK
jgi:antitoxin FitA